MLVGITDAGVVERPRQRRRERLLIPMARDAGVGGARRLPLLSQEWEGAGASAPRQKSCAAPAWCTARTTSGRRSRARRTNPSRAPRGASAAESVGAGGTRAGGAGALIVKASCTKGGVERTLVAFYLVCRVGHVDLRLGQVVGTGELGLGAGSSRCQGWLWRCRTGGWGRLHDVLRIEHREEGARRPRSRRSRRSSTFCARWA